MEIPLLTTTRKFNYLPYREQFSNILKGNLDFHEESSNYSSHAIHSFPAKFPPQLPRVFIEALTLPGDIVFDPMMGSGTTLLEASLLNRRALGTDIDPLALRISSVKLSVPSMTDIEKITDQVIEKASQRLTKSSKKIEMLVDSRFDEQSRTFVEYWFSKSAQLELAVLLDELQKIENPRIKGYLSISVSAVIIAKSGGVSLARDLAHTRPHRDLQKKPLSVMAELRKRIKRNIKNLSDNSFNSPGFLACEADAQKLPLANKSVDLIVTSPPYANHAIDYMRAHKFSLVWFGFPISKLSDLRQKYIGGDAINKAMLLPLPDTANQIIHSLSKIDSKKGLALHRYYSEMTLALSGMYRVLKPEKAAIVVVGNSVLRGVSTNTDICLAEIGKRVGFDLVHIGARNIDRNRRMLPVSKDRENGNNSQIEERMHEEYVIGFMKPGG